MYLNFFSLCSKFNPNVPRNAVLGKWRKPQKANIPAAMNVWTVPRTTTLIRQVITVPTTCTVTHSNHHSQAYFFVYMNPILYYFFIRGRGEASHATARLNSSEISFYLGIFSIISADMQPIYNRDMKVTSLPREIVIPLTGFLSSGS